MHPRRVYLAVAACALVVYTGALWNTFAFDDVANVVGRNELMAVCFTLLALYAALERQSVVWCATAFALGLLSKENAVVTPALVVWAWLLGIGRPERRKMAAFVSSWALVGAAYGAARWAGLHPYAGWEAVAPVFKGETPLTVRLTALAALADVVRLLLFPLHLRADYSPIERTAVHSAFDPRFLLGLALLLGWAALVRLAWRRGRRIEALGPGWIGIAYLPGANLLFPVGLRVAGRTLYLPSGGLALALGALPRDLQPRRLPPGLGIGPGVG